MPGAVANQFGRLARSANSVPPLHLLAGIGAVIVALTLVTPFAFEALGDNAFIALTILAGLLDDCSDSVLRSAHHPNVRYGSSLELGSF